MRRCMMMIGCLLLLVSCKSTPEKHSAVRSVKVDTVKVFGQAGSNLFPGKVMPASDLNLAFRVSGPIEKVYAKVGTYVRKGQVLAQIDPRDFELQLAATEAEYNSIKSEVDRIMGLHEKGSVTPNDYDKARFGYQQISAKLNAHRNALADTKLLAPCDGYIQKHLFEAGETVGAGIPVISMVAAGSAEVEVHIPSGDYIRRDQFESYYCTADIYPGKTFPLELIGITPKANASQLYTMRFRLAKVDGEQPGPGMSVMVTIRYRNDQAETLSIPLSALVQNDNQTSVWVYDPENSTVNAREVTLSEILTDGRAVVSSGLKAGELVLSAGVHSVKEGQKVSLLAVKSETNVGGML
ncbi:RND family efflux transporter, MFP subunit [Porphyromonadaceae bacterium KHP3R9]|nr:RND family efflux transporter, MFP subunit [Porphyromonadaceae bacterium KHP3R9]